MVEVNSETDLFGAPLQLPRERRGRPEHVRTRESANRVLLLFARGASPKEAAIALGITVPTLRKHYFSELERRAAAALMMEGTQLGRLNAAAEAGNVAAEKELMKALDKGRIKTVSSQVANRGAKPASAEKLGKKDAAIAAAKDLKGRFATRTPPPSLLN